LVLHFSNFEIQRTFGSRAFEEVFLIKSTTGGFYERITWKELWFRGGVLPSMLWV
jgi:hypothetical protein